MSEASSQTDQVTAATNHVSRLLHQAWQLTGMQPCLLKLPDVPELFAFNASQETFYARACDLAATIYQNLLEELPKKWKPILLENALASIRSDNYRIPATGKAMVTNTSAHEAAHDIAHRIALTLKYQCELEKATNLSQAMPAALKRFHADWPMLAECLSDENYQAIRADIKREWSLLRNLKAISNEPDPEEMSKTAGESEVSADAIIEALPEIKALPEIEVSTKVGRALAYLSKNPRASQRDIASEIDVNHQRIGDSPDYEIVRKAMKILIEEGRRTQRSSVRGAINKNGELEAWQVDEDND